MPFDPLLGLAEPTPGSPAARNTWGATLNTNFTLIGQAITGDNSYGSGVGGINIAGQSTFALSVTTGASNEARQLLYPFVGALIAPCTVTIAASVKIGWALNATTGAQDVILTSGGGAQLTLPPDELWHLFYSDGQGNVTSPGAAFGNFSPAGTTTVGGLTVTDLLTAGTIETSGSLTADVATVQSLTVANTLSGSANQAFITNLETAANSAAALSLETGTAGSEFSILLTENGAGQSGVSMVAGTAAVEGLSFVSAGTAAPIFFNQGSVTALEINAGGSVVATGEIVAASGSVAGSLGVGGAATVTGVLGNLAVPKAWVTFTVAAGACTIQRQFNVASVVYSVAGEYTITFTDPMSDTNYLICAAPSGTWRVNNYLLTQTKTKAVGSFLGVWTSGGSEGDPTEVCGVVIWD